MSVQAWMRGRWRISLRYTARGGERQEDIIGLSKKDAAITFRRMTRREGIVEVSLLLQPMDRFGQFSKERLVDVFKNEYKSNVPFDDEIPF